MNQRDAIQQTAQAALEQCEDAILSEKLLSELSATCLYEPVGLSILPEQLKALIVHLRVLEFALFEEAIVSREPVTPLALLMLGFDVGHTYVALHGPIVAPLQRGPS